MRSSRQRLGLRLGVRVRLDPCQCQCSQAHPLGVTQPPSQAGTGSCMFTGTTLRVTPGLRLRVVATPLAV